MRKNIIILIFLSSLLVSLQSNAGLLIEPHAALLLGDADWTQKTLETTYEHDGTAFGFELGGKVGFEYLLFMGGAELAYSHQNVQHIRKSTATSTFGERSTYLNTTNRTLFGLFGGIDLPVIPLKVWGSYYFQVNNKITYAKQKTQNPFAKDDSLKGTGYGVGAGFTAIPFIDLYVQLRLLEFNKWNHLGNTTTLPNADYPKFKVQEILIGVSLPI